MQRREVLRNLPWIRKGINEWSEHEAELAEERLWDAYFSDTEKAIHPNEFARVISDKMSDDIYARMARVDQIEARLERLDELVHRTVERLDLPVLIYVKDAHVDARTAEPLVEAVLTFLNTFDFVPEPRQDWVLSLGSFKARLRAVLRAVLGRDALETVLKEIEQAMTNRFVLLPGSQVNLNEAEATARLITALSNIQEAVVVIGPVILVKRTVAGSSQLFTVPLFSAIRAALDANPSHLASPDALYALLRRTQDSQVEKLDRGDYGG